MVILTGADVAQLVRVCRVTTIRNLFWASALSKLQSQRCTYKPIIQCVTLTSIYDASPVT